MIDETAKNTSIQKLLEVVQDVHFSISENGISFVAILVKKGSGKVRIVGGKTKTLLENSLEEFKNEYDDIEILEIITRQ